MWIFNNEEYKVNTTTLDLYYKNKSVDILWVDVQGAEKMVLEGSKETLKKLKAIFIEVTIDCEYYEESAKKSFIDEMLVFNGFELVLLGTDFNLTGNALYLKRELNSQI